MLLLRLQQMKVKEFQEYLKSEASKIWSEKDIDIDKLRNGIEKITAELAPKIKTVTKNEINMRLRELIGE